MYSTTKTLHRSTIYIVDIWYFVFGKKEGSYDSDVIPAYDTKSKFNIRKYGKFLNIFIL